MIRLTFLYKRIIFFLIRKTSAVRENFKDQKIMMAVVDMMISKF